jgi:hypothetical protein
MGAWGK